MSQEDRRKLELYGSKTRNAFELLAKHIAQSFFTETFTKKTVVHVSDKQAKIVLKNVCKFLRLLNTLRFKSFDFLGNPGTIAVYDY